MSMTSFSDVTNIPQGKHGSLSHSSSSRQKLKKTPTLNAAMFVELNAKIDCFSHKIDGIYDMLQTLLATQSQASQPILQSTEFTGTPSSASRYEDVQGAAVLCKDAFQQRNAYLSQTDALLLAERQEASTMPVTKVLAARDEAVKSRDRKDFSSLKRTGSVEMRGGGGSDGCDAPLWPKNDCFILLVEFKCQRLKRCESDVFIVPGQYVIVQGDRGYDCGVVNQCSEWSAEKGCFTREESLDGSLVNVVRMKSDICRVLRVATEEEVERLFGEIARNENLALKTCREIVARMGLDMDVVDCEYQFDQQKISFYYEASHSIDFRQLNGELYRIFGVRIWLQNVNNAVKNVVPSGAMSKDDKVQYQRSGLRPQLFK